MNYTLSREYIKPILQLCCHGIYTYITVIMVYTYITVSIVYIYIYIYIYIIYNYIILIMV